MQVPNDRSEPIAFEVTTRPAAEAADGGARRGERPKRGERPWLVHMVLPAAAIYPQNVSGSVATDEMGTAIMVVNRYGDPLARKLEKVTVRLDEEKLRAAPASKLAVDEPIDLPTGEDYLYVAVWDLRTGRMGAVEVTANVPKASRKSQ